VATPSDGGAWLVEIYGGENTADLHGSLPYVRLLVAEAVRGASPELPMQVPYSLRLA
jgi:hypothetical protein